MLNSKVTNFSTFSGLREAFHVALVAHRSPFSHVRTAPLLPRAHQRIRGQRRGLGSGKWRLHRPRRGPVRGPHVHAAEGVRLESPVGHEQGGAVLGIRNIFAVVVNVKFVTLVAR